MKTSATTCTSKLEIEAKEQTVMNEPTVILVVDDEESMRSYLATLLRLNGYEVVAVSSGKEAIEHLSCNPAPSLVLLDVLMPEVDGLETLRRLRQNDKGLPVIMLSCICEAGTIAEALRCGATDYLNKPFEEADLEKAIPKVLDCKKTCPYQELH